MLHQHQNSRSYVASAAAATVTELYIGRSGNMKDKVPMGCHRPRSVCIHARNGQIDARALISKLAEAEAPITHIQRLGNGDMEITFPSIEVRNKPSEEPPAPADKAEVVFPDPPPPLDWANSQPDDTVPPTTNKVTVLILCLLRQQSRHLTTTIIKPLQTAQKPMQTRGTQS
eukprot:gene15894-7226_t